MDVIRDLIFLLLMLFNPSLMSVKPVKDALRLTPEVNRSWMLEMMRLLSVLTLRSMTTRAWKYRYTTIKHISI